MFTHQSVEILHLLLNMYIIIHFYILFYRFFHQPFLESHLYNKDVPGKRRWAAHCEDYRPSYSKAIRSYKRVSTDQEEYLSHIIQGIPHKAARPDIGTVEKVGATSTVTSAGDSSTLKFVFNINVNK